MKKTRNKAGQPPAHAASFPIVGIGASAGGLEAFSQLLESLPPDTGMAFVLVQHLDPKHVSFLTDALRRATKMPVEEVKDRAPLAPNHVYVIPPNADLALADGGIKVLPRTLDSRRIHMPIDHFFRSLAADRQGQAIGVVLSGSASDGTEGLRAIKAESGVTLAQDPATAKFDSMPKSAIAAGVTDLHLPLPELAQELARLAHHPYLTSGTAEVPAVVEDIQDWERIFGLLRAGVGIDFSEYKRTTLGRRLARRMALHHTKTVGEYAEILQKIPDEARELYEDILIHVTSFFRDPEVFERLKQRVFPEILRAKAAGEPIRIWVTGCSTGQEAYSMAIALLEFLAGVRAKHPVQVFGTDISERAIEVARAGFYSESAVRDVSPERLRKFFTKAEGGYRIAKHVRDLFIFVRHDLARDPPFSRVDLVSCRNVLIYFNPPLQRRILSTIQYCLNQPGFLVLGHTETATGREQLFTVVDKAERIFARTGVAAAARFMPLAGDRFIERAHFERPSPHPAGTPGLDLAKHVDQVLLGQYVPPGVLINERMDVLQFRGRTGVYLEQPSGHPQLNLLKMAREGLLADLRLAIGHARTDLTTVRREGVTFQHGEDQRRCNVVVIPVSAAPEAKERFFLVLFEEGRPDAGSGRKKRQGQGDDKRTDKLEHELRATREYLQSVIDEHQRTNEALTSSNEELVSTNEELQSMNEELETAKEELQSTNEELSTVNDELQHRNLELSQANNDLVNVLNSVEIPIVILDIDHRIRRFTPKARSIMNLLPTDVGRPFTDIRSNIVVEDLEKHIAEVIENVRPWESDVQDREGRWHRLQVRPYRTLDNRIDGAVVALVDVNDLARAVQAAEWSRDYANDIVAATPVPLVVLDRDVMVMSANKAFYDLFGVSEAETESRSLFDLGFGQWDIPRLRESLIEMTEKKTRFRSVEFEREFPRLGNRIMSLSARPMQSSAGLPMLLLTIEDITEWRRAEAQREDLLRQTEAAKYKEEEANRTKDLFLATLSHELRTPLTSMLMQTQLLRRGILAPDEVARSLEAVERAARVQAQLIEDLLDVSRIVAGKLPMELRPIDLAEVVSAALETVRSQAVRKKVALVSDIDPDVGRVSGDPSRLQQVVWNLVVNAIKFTTSGGQVTVSCHSTDGDVWLSVTDTGMGIAPEFLPSIFERFTQATPHSARNHGGLGLGLAIVKHVVEAHGGSIDVTSGGKGQGATFTVTLHRLQRDAELEVHEECEAQRRADERQPPNLAGLKVLVVDDDPGTREALTAMLRHVQVDVRAAASAREGVRIFEEHRPDVLISDVAMPDEDGHAMLRRIRKLGPERGGDVPAVALTALASEEDRRAALDAGFQMHLAKPVDFERLSAAIDEVRRIRGGGRRAGGNR